MAKLHELLAALPGVQTQAEKTRTELGTSFDKKRHLFGEKLVTFQPREEGAQRVVEEVSTLQTSVKKELAWISDIIAPALDIAHQVNEANTVARADVILDDGTVILRSVPATLLLELEKRVSEMHSLALQIVTLDPAKGFTLDPDRGDGVYKAREDIKTRTKKVQQPIVLYEATKEHPAQVQLIPVDVPVGEIRTQEWSGLITPGEKADILVRAEHLKRAIKTARSRANEVEVTPIKTGRTLLDYVFVGTRPVA